MSCHVMPLVKKCDVNQCFFNRDMQCHVPAINIGGETHPKCDTFISKENHIDCSGASGVGACHTSICKNNIDLTCNAPEISISCHGDHADCCTFIPR